MLLSKSNHQLLARVEKLHKEYLKIKPQDFSDKEKFYVINSLTYHSNKLEGMTLSYGDTMNYLNKGLIRKDSPLKDIADLENHREVLLEIFDSYDSLKIDSDTIRRLHGVLMKDPIQWENKDVYNNSAGQFKQTNNFGVRAKGKYKEYMTWIDVPSAIQRLCQNFDGTGEKHRLLSIIDFHFEFANNIHPFWDGNGRMARLITNLMLLKSDYPVLNIPAQDKNKYLKAIIGQESDPDKGAFISFMLSGIEKQLYSKLSK